MLYSAKEKKCSHFHEDCLVRKIADVFLTAESQGRGRALNPSSASPCCLVVLTEEWESVFPNVFYFEMKMNVLSK